MRKLRIFHQLARIDRSAIGVSFVDLLFALALAQIFVPIASWAANPKKNPLPLTSWTSLILVAFAITITSWIGYHASANRARFTVSFINVELVKLVLDVLMVAIYFVLASYGGRPRQPNDREASLVALTFVLYMLWDVASWRQKHGEQNKYKAEWEKVRADRSRAEVAEDDAWKPTDFGRMLATAIALIASLVTAGIVIFVVGPLGKWGTVILDVELFVIILGYRILKEALTTETPKA
jgi:hypothetical protein